MHIQSHKPLDANLGTDSFQILGVHLLGSKEEIHHE